MTAVEQAPSSVVVTEPGLYRMTDDDYFGDPVPGGSLSHSGAKRLLPPSCPAIFDHQRRHPPKPTRAMQFGKMAHRAVLGIGAELDVLPESVENYQTKYARELRDAAIAAGKVPVLAREAEVILDMAAALRAHPLAGAIFDPQHGEPEVAAFWTDPTTGIWCRAKYDWLPDRVAGRRLVLPDYKSASSAYPLDFSRSAADYAYASQAAWYLDGLRELGVDPDPSCVFVVQDKEPPYPVSVCQLDREALKVGAELNDQARRIYAECTASGVWPQYSDEVSLVALPMWFLARHGR